MRHQAAIEVQGVIQPFFLLSILCQERQSIAAVFALLKLLL